MTTKKDGYNPFQTYLMMGAGACLIAIRFFDDREEWSTLDMVKIGAGALLIVYGIYKLVKRK